MNKPEEDLFQKSLHQEADFYKGLAKHGYKSIWSFSLAFLFFLFLLFSGIAVIAILIFASIGGVIESENPFFMISSILIPLLYGLMVILVAFKILRNLIYNFKQKDKKFKLISSAIAIISSILLIVLTSMALVKFFTFAFSSEPLQNTQIKLGADETANWKTYRNEEYGFEIKFPNSWPNAVFKKDDFITNGSFPARDAFWRLYLGNKQNLNCLTIDQKVPFFIEEYPADNYNQTIEILLKNDSGQSVTTYYKKEVINGATVIWYTEGGMGNECDAIYTMVFGNNRIIRFANIFPTTFQSNKNGDELEKIISTFKFIQTDPKLLNYIKNSEYKFGDNSDKFILKNGYWEKNGSLGFYSSEITNLATGDLNNDGELDAASILLNIRGGSGGFFQLTGITNQNGNFSKTEPIDIDDRAVINSISINSGIITIDAIVHGPWDSMANPTLRKILRYKVEGNKLIDIDLGSYKNEKYGYEISILPGWEVKNALTSPEQIEIAKINKNERGDLFMIITVEGLNQNILENNLLNWLKDNHKYDVYEHPEWADINGYPKYRADVYQTEGGAPSKDTFVLIGKMILHFSCYINIEKYPTDNLISSSSGECDKMVDSLKIN